MKLLLADICFTQRPLIIPVIPVPKRHANLKGVIKLFYKKEQTTYKDMLLKIGYPICVSNRSDPFSRNNYLDTAALFTHLAGMPNGIFIQTKCGPGMDEAIDKLNGKRDICFYITITTMQDDISKRVEPFAPVTSVWNDPLHRVSMQRHCLLRLTNQQDAAGNVVMYFDGTVSLGKKKEVIEL